MKDKKKSKFSFLRRLFGNRNKVLSFMEEEQLQSPGRMIVKNFTHNKLGMAGLIIFLCIFLFVMVGPYFFPLDLSYQDNTQTNVPPGLNFLSAPKELEGNVVDITPGTTFAVGVGKDGNIHVWGYTKITDKIDLADIPEEVKAANIVSIAAGYDHIVAMDDKGAIYIWGNRRLGQDALPDELAMASTYGKDLHIKQIEASYQFSAALTEEGKLYLWGNKNMADLKVKKEYQGHIQKVALTTYSYVSLLDDGSVVYSGFEKDNSLVNVPEELSSGVVDIAGTSNAVAAVKDDGTVIVWGNCDKGENKVPYFESKPVELYGGRYHFTALMDDGEVISWGDNTHGQASVPESVNSEEIETVFAGFYQNYAVTKSGEIKTWGLKGYLCGTDNLGRDVLNRIVNGGKVTMTVGAISVIISLVIGIILGGLAGYFGGWVDMVIMRISEVVGGLPFIPFAMILSAIIGTRISVEQRMYLIMVVLGVLSWPGICHLIRAQILSQREQEYVTAAKSMGVRERSIIFRHIIPNVMSLILVDATLEFATCMLTESTLSYLGFGIAPPTPTWGNLLTGANNSIVIQQFWWRWVFPAAIFGICTICINLVGDALRDAVDPKSAER
ncbi:MAG: ABC transporter permease subunit [Oscillospiraceae bacterium]|nr:ABC transporter permease subunit [Oscillospiraceae bacterium]